MMEKILLLRNEWHRNFSRKAEGGINALSGFNYQFGVFLLNVLEKWSTERKNGASIPRAKPFLESISDITDLSSDGIIYVTQVKLNLPKSYGKIFDEFWDILNLAKNVMPGDAARLRFVLCTSTGPVPNLRKEFQTWVKGKLIPALRATEFESMISSKSVPEPHDRILGILANELHDPNPSQHLLSWLGRLLAASSKEGLDSAVERILDDLVEIVNTKETRSNSIYVWESADRPPSQAGMGDFLTGQQPRPFHLRGGYFAPRSVVYNDVFEEFIQWRQSHYEGGDCSLRLPVFWIGGRSGSGKSVALLHLLSRIHSQENTHVFWIGPEVSSLPDAIQWAAVLCEKGRDAVVAVDDPFAPATQEHARVWKEALASLESLRCEGDISGMPVLVCCGPTEHAQNLNHAHPDDVSVHIAPLPAEEKRDLDELRAWYRRRTGSEAPDVGDENVLLVQLFFQWRSKVTLPEFAKRFQNRLIDADPRGDLQNNLQNIFSRVLAANRLYLGYPQIAFENSLPDGLRDMVEQLKREYHVADMSMGRDGVWLAHPHLSNAIYEWWYPSDSKLHARARHLSDLINDALCYGESPRERMAPLWAVSRSLSARPDEEPFVGRLDHQTISRILPNTFKQRIEASGGQLSISELPVWIQIRATFPEIPLSPDPFDLAINKLRPENVTNVGLRLTCHKLLQHRTSMSASQSAAFTINLTMLLKATIHSWHEWPHVAADAYKRIGDKNTELLLIEWIKSNEGRTVVPRILLDLLQADRHSAVIDDTAATILALHSDDSMIWSDIAKQIIKRRRSDNAVKTVCQWASLHSNEFRTGFLLAEMIRRSIPGAVDWALKWAQRWHEERSANWVLEALCEQSRPDPAVRDLCIAWLSHDYPQSNPGYLAEKLIRAYPDDPVVRQAILLWLQQASPSRAWSYVWDTAFTDAPSDSRLVSLGVDALEFIRPEHRSWLAFWQKLWNQTRQDKRLISIALNRLRDVPMTRLAWIADWTMLWNATNGTSELVEIGLEWLDINTRNRTWGGLWGLFWKLRHGDNRLILLAQKWLSNNMWQWNVWFAIWDAIWKVDKKNESILGLAHRWLSTAPLSLPSWFSVWERVWRYGGADDVLRDLAKQWLQGTRREHNDWQTVWAFLWGDKKGDGELQKMGHEWLEIVPMSHGSWPKMWKDLWPLDKGNVTMVQRGLEWVSKQTNFDHGDWQHNWKELVKARKRDGSLLRLGEKWLRVTPSYSNYWVDVWWFLSEHTPSTLTMLDMARQWLQETSPKGNNKWPKLWLRIKENGVATNALRRKVRAYIDANPMDTEWYHLWTSLRVSDGDNKELDEVGRRWLSHMLQAQPDTQSWHQVWTTLWETTFDREILFSQAVEWLPRVSPNNTTWHRIWCMISETQPIREDVVKIGRNWLQDVRPHHQGWYRVWSVLFRNSKDTGELLTAAATWLANTQVLHTAWGDMWLTLYHHGERKEALRSLALTWLAQTASRQKPHSWPSIWRLLWDSNTSHEQLFIIGVEWLKVSLSSGLWAEVFDPLWNSGRDREILQEMDDRRRLMKHDSTRIDDATRDGGTSIIQ